MAKANGNTVCSFNLGGKSNPEVWALCFEIDQPGFLGCPCISSQVSAQNRFSLGHFSIGCNLLPGLLGIHKPLYHLGGTRCQWVLGAAQVGPIIIEVGSRPCPDGGTLHNSLSKPSDRAEMTVGKRV